LAKVEEDEEKKAEFLKLCDDVSAVSFPSLSNPQL